MLRKKNSAPTLHLITDEDARRAEAQRNINRHLVKYFAIKAGVAVALGIATHIIAKKLDASETTSSED